jgi:glycosyltransferase involved in cell wall biosynthesis
MTKVSVILPVYNAGAHLHLTLESILHQQGIMQDFDLELIVIDDCSTDNTRDILHQYNIEFLSTSQNTGGPNAGRNIGLAHATGDVICLIDHDDIWCPNKIRMQLDAIAHSPVVISAYKVVDNVNGQCIDYGDADDQCINTSKNEVFLRKLAKAKNGIQIYPGTMMFVKELKNIRFEEEYGMLDFDWQLRMFENRQVAEIPAALMTRIVHGSNLSLNKTYRSHDYDYAMQVFRAYETKYPRAVAHARKCLNGSMGRYFYLSGEMDAARMYFRKSFWDLKTLLYYCTSYYGGNVVKKHFRVFG